MYKKLFDLSKSEWKDFFYLNPNEMLDNLEDILKSISHNYRKIQQTEEFSKNGIFIEGDVFVGENVEIQHNVFIKGTVVISDNVFVGANSFIRDNVFIGKNCKIGYSNEICNTILLDNSIVSHVDIISSSIIGSNVHFGSNVITMSDFMLKDKFAQKSPSFYGFSSKKVTNNFYKLGSLIGDNVNIGSYVGFNPGVVIEKNTIIYPGIILPWGNYKINSIILNKEKNFIVK